MSIESVMPSNHLILCHPLLLLPSIFSSIRVFSNESVLRISCPKYWSFSFSISPSKEYSGLISFRMGWLDLLAVQGTQKSLLQHHSSKASILRHSAFFIGPSVILKARGNQGCWMILLFPANYKGFGQTNTPRPTRAFPLCRNISQNKPTVRRREEGHSIFLGLQMTATDLALIFPALAL